MNRNDLPKYSDKDGRIYFYLLVEMETHNDKPHVINELRRRDPHVWISPIGNPRMQWIFTTVSQSDIEDIIGVKSTIHANHDIMECIRANIHLI